MNNVPDVWLWQARVESQISQYHLCSLKEEFAPKLTLKCHQHCNQVNFQLATYAKFTKCVIMSCSKVGQNHTYVLNEHIYSQKRVIMSTWKCVVNGLARLPQQRIVLRRSEGKSEDVQIEWTETKIYWPWPEFRCTLSSMNYRSFLSFWDRDGRNRIFHRVHSGKSSGENKIFSS